MLFNQNSLCRCRPGVFSAFIDLLPSKAVSLFVFRLKVRFAKNYSLVVLCLLGTVDCQVVKQQVCRALDPQVRRKAWFWDGSFRIDCIPQHGIQACAMVWRDSRSRYINDALMHSPECCPYQLLIDRSRWGGKGGGSADRAEASVVERRSTSIFAKGENNPVFPSCFN